MIFIAFLIVWVWLINLEDEKDELKERLNKLEKDGTH